MLDLVSVLAARGLLAVVRAAGPDIALDTVRTLVRCGVSLIEVSLTTPGAEVVLERASSELGDEVVLGAGTVRTTADADSAAAAGARFTVTPAVNEAIAHSRSLGLPVLAGALTPTEVHNALAEGAAAIKLFPASLGGVQYLRALRAPYPEVAFVPVGGVEENSVRAYLDAGAIAVGVGDPLVGDPIGRTERIARYHGLATRP
ncbi:bifunctional 4-hydroxy-2-oxoglutarate aldolase/2-dehydro-3-deoxy-phosphogluconate aldolase [Lentzea sp. NPDC051208]|uniref:bifunctional 4-hydroxy-2-oxoglutarate aldolase/2-dehydro-3-deoxy-phosphogluconate aldolase n=1 Tax=Lentzea sp. NPDC051208 TaxID=3154642 RepID=UPI003427526E